MVKTWVRVALLMLLGSSLATASEAADGLSCDRDAPAANLTLTLKDMSGSDVSLSIYKGKVILLNFWATWCGPCKVEIPGFVDLYKRYQARGLIVLGVSIDDPVDKLKPFAEGMKINYPVLLGLGREDVQKAYPLFGVPNTYIIRRDGRICRHHMGLATKEQVESDIKTLL